MTQATFATHNFELVRSPRRPSCGQRNAVRSILASARPILPDNNFRRTKFLTARNIWKEGRSVSASPVEDYLAELGWMRDTVLPNDVRFHTSVLFEPTRERFPAMICAVRNRDGVFVGIHRIATEGIIQCIPDVNGNYFWQPMGAGIVRYDATTSCNVAGALRWNGSAIQYCDGANWQSIGGGLTTVVGGCQTSWSSCPAGYTATSYFSPGTYNCCDKCGNPSWKYTVCSQ